MSQSEISIQIQGLSKQYRIGDQQKQYQTFREKLTEIAAAPFHRLRAVVQGRSTIISDQSFWALKDVSFEVNCGEVIGVIGRNGAGKTTLLKILSRITKPTEGCVRINGRVGSLLEVGTGFHPELTGRENVFLNGAILGMAKTEIERKFDEIVAFAEIEKFIDMPVKRYSSGMYVRLAFAVAAHLDPEILLVDEVLAVGDARFQRKCLNKMQDIGQGGRTIIFVSHNMPAVTRLCERTILLDEGVVLADGPSHAVVSQYLTSDQGTTAARTWSVLSKAPGNDVVRLRAVRVRTENGQITDVVDIRKPIGIDIEYEVLKSDNVLVPNLHVYNGDGIYAFVTIDSDLEWRGKPKPVGRYVSTAWIPGNFLSEGRLIVTVHISTLQPKIVHVREKDVVAFLVVDSAEGDSARGDFAGPLGGVVRPLLPWTTKVFQKNQEHHLTTAEVEP